MAERRFHVECANGYETHVKTDDKSAAESWVRVIDGAKPWTLHACNRGPHVVVDTQKEKADA